MSLDEDAPESAVEKMAFEPVPPVEPLGVDTVEPLHPGRNIRARCLDEQMEMVRHQAIGMAPPFEPLDDVLEDLLEPKPIARVGEDIGLADAA